MNKSIPAIIESTKKFFWRHHLTMFIVVAAGSIAFAIFLLIQVVEKSSNIGAYTPSNADTFDTETIQRVRELNDRPTYDFSLPTNQRNNPFTE